MECSIPERWSADSGWINYCSDELGHPGPHSWEELKVRDDELTRVPKSIEPWRVMEFLESLGITPKDTYETTFGVRAVTVRLYATDETGHRYLGEDGNAAEHVVSIPFVGSWEKPVPEVGSKNNQDPVLCGAWRKLGGWRMECVKEAGHEMDHDYSVDTGRILGDVPQA